MQYFQSEIIQITSPSASRAANDVNYQSRFGRNARTKSTYGKQFGYQRKKFDTGFDSTGIESNRKISSLFDDAA